MSTTTERIKEYDEILHQWFDKDEDEPGGGWIRFKEDAEFGPVLADTRSKEDGDDIVFACNTAIKMAELLERAMILLDYLVPPNTSFGDEVIELKADFAAFQKGEG